MVNKDDIEIGYLEIFSWENHSVTDDRFCHDVAQLEWVLPNETTEFFLQFLKLWQEVILQDCLLLSPLVDSGFRKRKIYIKSKAFKKRLSSNSIEFFKTLPFGPPMLDLGQIFFPQYVEHIKFNDLNLAMNWDDYIFKNTGYSTARYHSKKTKFWVPNSDEKMVNHYNVIWRKHLFQDEILEKIFDHKDQ